MSIVLVLILTSIVGLLGKVAETGPINKDGHPNGIWFGTLSRSCLGTRHGSLQPNSERSLCETACRLVYFRNLVFEWNGTGFHSRQLKRTEECRVRWESKPVGESLCSTNQAKKFRANYESTYGEYDVCTNNAQIFANRLTIFLISTKCKMIKTKPNPAILIQRNKASTGMSSVDFLDEPGFLDVSQRTSPDVQPDIRDPKPTNEISQKFLRRKRRAVLSEDNSDTGSG